MHKLKNSRKLTACLALLFLLVIIYCITRQFFVASSQNHIATSIQKKRGNVIYDFMIEDGSGSLDVGAIPWEPEWLQVFIGIDWFHSIAAIDLTEDCGKKEFEQVTNLPRVNHLSSLTISSNNIGDVEFSSVSRMKNLSLLRIEKSTATGEALQHIKNLKFLKTLDIRGLSISDRNIHYMNDIPNLKSLSFSGSQITNLGLKSIKNLKKLERLVIHCPRVTSDGMDILKTMNTLIYIDLSYCSMYNIDFLRYCPQVEFLKLTNTPIELGGLRSIVFLKNLVDLDVSDSKITDHDLMYLENASQLTILSLNNTKISDAGVHVLGSLSSLKFLAAKNTDISNEAFIGLEKTHEELSVFK